jgi:Ca-activated chloride channel family protein
VLLLSDGQANVGLRDAEQITPRVAHAARQGVSTSTYGLGHHFNEHLMMSMAKAGQGNGYYGESADDLMDPFREELELLNDLCARRLDLTLEAPAGVRINLLNDYEQLSPGRWRLPDLAHGSEAWALAEIRVPAEVARSRGVNEIEILRAALDFEPLDGGRHHAKPARLVLPFMPAWEFDALDINETVSARLQEVRAADIQVRASRAARHQQWDVVDQLLATARSECANNPWLLESLDSLTRYASRRDTECFSKEAAFKSQKLKSRLVDPNELACSYSIAEQAESSSYLRRKPEQGKRL